jgi:hypothetical protein
MVSITLRHAHYENSLFRHAELLAEHLNDGVIPVEVNAWQSPTIDSTNCQVDHSSNIECSKTAVFAFLIGENRQAD